MKNIRKSKVFINHVEQNITKSVRFQNSFVRFSTKSILIHKDANDICIIEKLSNLKTCRIKVFEK